MKRKELIPVTVLTGFLGAGKTTLLSRALSQPQNRKFAVIINEFGAVNIDHHLVVGADEDIIELNNGCLCCRVRGDLIRSLSNLLQKQKRFDYVLVETTGLANPGPVAQTFSLPELSEHLRLDAIVTLVDARHLEKELADAPEASAQIGFADIVLLNKTDLATTDDLDRVESKIRRMNPLARVYRTHRAELAAELWLGVQARALSTELALHGHGGSRSGNGSDRAPEGGREEAATPDPHAPHEGEAAEDGGHDHHHDEQVRSFVLRDSRPLDLRKAEAWLSGLLTELGPNIYRSKGILHIRGHAKRVIFQAVQMVFDASPDRLWKPGEAKETCLVFIGRDLDESRIRRSFEDCVAT